MGCLTEIGLSRKQRTFVALETTCGTLKFPSATVDYVIPAGDAVMNQNPTFVDSEEKKNTLDLTDRFQNAMPAGEWSIPMYLRIPDKSFATPQGDALFRAWQGDLGSMATFTLSFNYATADALLHASGLDADHYLPGVGVILVESNAGASDSYIHYGVLYRAENSATCSFGDLSYDYAGSHTRATADQPNTITPASRFYRLDVDSPSVSIWIETDHFVQGLAGASVNNVVLGVNNEGAVTLTFSGQGMEMVWAGEAALATLATAAVGYITVPSGHGKRFSVGAYIYNQTTTPGTAASIGFEIGSITMGGGDGGGDLITFATPLSGDNHNFAWEVPDGGWLGPGGGGSTIRGYLPLNPTTIGTPIESRLSDIELDDVAAKLKGGDVTFSFPKKYIDDEVGLDYPEDFIEDRRSITSTLSVYFRKDNAKYFTDGYNGEECPVLFKFGDTEGSYLEVYMKRCALEVPTVTFAAPAVELSIPLTALGTYGEDSVDVVLT